MSDNDLNPSRPKPAGEERREYPIVVGEKDFHGGGNILGQSPELDGESGHAPEQFGKRSLDPAEIPLPSHRLESHRCRDRLVRPDRSPNWQRRWYAVSYNSSTTASAA